MMPRKPPSMPPMRCPSRKKATAATASRKLRSPERSAASGCARPAAEILGPLVQQLGQAFSRLRQIPEDLGEVYELVYEFIRKGGKLPVYARWIEGERART
jgi:hypothetical protein